MSQELIGIIIAAIALAAILVSGQWALRRDIAALGESTRKEYVSHAFRLPSCMRLRRALFLS